MLRRFESFTLLMRTVYLVLDVQRDYYTFEEVRGVFASERAARKALAAGLGNELQAWTVTKLKDVGNVDTANDSITLVESPER